MAKATSFSQCQYCLKYIRLVMIKTYRDNTRAKPVAVVSLMEKNQTKTHVWKTYQVCFNKTRKCLRYTIGDKKDLVADEQLNLQFMLKFCNR